MRADRLLSLTLLLRHRGRMTAAALAAELEVSQRTVLRDVEALSAAGIPVYAERGRHGGFALLPGFTTDLTGLTPGEAVALLTSGSVATSGALGLGPEFSSAMRKIVAAMPETARTRAAGAAGRVLVRSGGLLADPADDGTPALDAVQRAVFGGTRLRIRYRAGGGPRREGPVPAPVQRVVDPVGLVQASGRWYLLAIRDGEDRTYRVSRIGSAEVLDEPARRPDGVDLEQLWLRRRADFRDRHPGVAVRVRVAAAARHLLAGLTVGDERSDGGTVEVTAAFGDLRHAATMLWPLLPEVEIVAPGELRATLLGRARAAVVALG
ncbi:helix-turn-helix transcriptional regulator [Pseudonocardia sp. HH130630-07]|uniref:helix-turn-helix transcriptional regulator n=1 Tax=Pseudonocardia sp. HH130630-07 TaxID=1690815 RepID=UPI0008150120|nr:WYL domain-containing protein [Pseudonocardia sp. HH130630-07]ANY07142.1 DNA-binding transcriptional regulator [Pseudonocardia sp. HH130630-07]